MIVLGRKKGEGLVVAVPPGFSGDIRVLICSVHGNQVRVGIEAPREVHVRREELPRREAKSQGGQS